MKKTFDCVEMKLEIQTRHQREDEVLGKAEAERVRWQRVLNDPVLGAFVRAHPAQRSTKNEKESVQ
jgi:hypothetical protein